MIIPLLDWRRTLASAYAAARDAADPATAWQAWRDARDQLFHEHSQSPLSPAARASFTGLPYAPYQPALRFTVPVTPAEPAHLEVGTGTDGVVPFDRIGRVTIPDLGFLDVWWLGSYGGGVFVPVKDGSAGRTT